MTNPLFALGITAVGTVPSRPGRTLVHFTQNRTWATWGEHEQMTGRIEALYRYDSTGDLCGVRIPLWSTR